MGRRVVSRAAVLVLCVCLSVSSFPASSAAALMSTIATQPAAAKTSVVSLTTQLANHAERTSPQAPDALHLPPVADNALSIFRVQSAQSAADVSAGVLQVTFTVRNNLAPLNSPGRPATETITQTVARLSAFNYAGDPNTIHNVVVADTLVTPTALLSTWPIAADRQNSQVIFNLGDVAPLQSVTFTLSLRAPATSSAFLTFDGGANAWGIAQGRTVSAASAPVALAPDNLGVWLRWTVDADTQDAYMLQKLGALGSDPLSLFAYVQSLHYDSYKGSLRGTRGTLWSQAGNSLDKASLLIAMLRADGVPARYRHGMLTITATQVLINSMFPAAPRLLGNPQPALSRPTPPATSSCRPRAPTIGGWRRICPRSLRGGTSTPRLRGRRLDGPMWTTRRSRSMAPTALPRRPMLRVTK